MSISLTEAMKIFPFSEAVLVAGAAGIETVVESVNIQEIPQITRWLKGGEIVFTAGYAFQEPGEGVELIRRLKEKKAAALAVKPGQYLPSIPSDMIACSNEIGFALFELPEMLPYMDCIVPILERLTQKRLYALEKSEAIRERLTRSLIQGKGLDGLCKVLESTFDCSVMVMTPQGLVLSHSLRTEDEQVFEEKLKHLCRRTFQHASTELLAVNTCTSMMVSGVCVVSYPISVENELLAVLFVTSSECSLDSIQMLLLENVGSMVTIELIKEREVVAHEQKVTGQFLESLLNSSYLDETNMHRWASYIGFDIMKPACIFILGMDVHKTLRSDTRVTEAMLQQLKVTAMERLKYYFRRYAKPVLFMENSMNIIALATVETEDHFLSCRLNLEQTIEALRRENTNSDFFAGIGRVKQHITAVTASHKEARQALKTAVKMDRPVCDFASLGALGFLGEVSESEAMQDFKAEYLASILQFDCEYHASLLDTLSAYFSAGQNVRKTAEYLLIHKNSVIYRLSKVEELLGRSLKDPRVAFNIQLSLKLKELEK